MSGLYIHIPFCKSRCIYCGFYSTTLLSLQDRYVDALCRELELRLASQQLPLSTIGLDGVLYFLGFKDSYLDELAK